MPQDRTPEPADVDAEEIEVVAHGLDEEERIVCTVTGGDIL
ncbi:hypothetical protein ACGFMM_23800 [Streptomyces sp. NPDC048604]